MDGQTIAVIMSVLGVNVGLGGFLHTIMRDHKNDAGKKFKVIAEKFARVDKLGWQRRLDPHGGGDTLRSIAPALRNGVHSHP